MTLDSNSYSLLADLGKPQKTTPAPSVTPGGHPAASGSRFRGSSPQESASAELARLVEGVFSEIASQRLTIDGLLAENANLAADNERLRELLDGLRDSYETELANLQSPPESEAG